MSSITSGDKLFGVETAFLKLLILPIGVLFVFILSLFLVIIPRITAIQDIRKKAADTDKLTQSVSEKNQYLTGIDPADLKQNSDRLNSAIFAEKNSYFLIDIIRSISDQYGFQIQSFSLSPGEIKQDSLTAKKEAIDVVIKVPVDIIVVGPKEKYLDYIEAIEKNLPVLSMDKFQVKSEQGSVQLDLILSSYYVPTQLENDISKLTLADLTLTKDESDLISRLSSFKEANTSNVGVGVTNSQGFIKYVRPNPFSF